MFTSPRRWGYIPPSRQGYWGTHTTIEAGILGCSHRHRGVNIRQFTPSKVGILGGVYTTAVGLYGAFTALMGQGHQGHSAHPVCCLPAHCLSPFLPLGVENQPSHAIFASLPGTGTPPPPSQGGQWGPTAAGLRFHRLCRRRTRVSCRHMVHTKTSRSTYSLPTRTRQACLSLPASAPLQVRR